MPSGRTEARQTTCCATQEREKLAYVAQSRWLMEFGTSLEEEFGIDPFTLLVLKSLEPLREEVRSAAASVDVRPPGAYSSSSGSLITAGSS